MAAFLAPADGLGTWSEPDPSSPQGPPLAPGTEVEVVERRGDWAKVTCANGFSGWVDGRLLTAAAGGGDVLDKVAGLDFSFSRPLVMAALLFVAGVLPWTRGLFTASGYDVPMTFLFDYKTTMGGGLSVGMLLLVAAVVGGAGVVLPDKEVLRRVAGFGAVVVAALFTLQVQRLAGLPGSPGLLKTIGFGVPVAVAAGLMLALSKPEAPSP